MNVYMYDRLGRGKRKERLNGKVKNTKVTEIIYMFVSRVFP